MYELKKIGKVFTSKFVGTGPSSYEKRIYRAAVVQRLTNTAIYVWRQEMCAHFTGQTKIMIVKYFLSTEKKNRSCSQRHEHPQQPA